MRNDCPFCQHLRDAEYDYFDEHAVAFVPLNPVTPGHFLVVPKVHITDFTGDPKIAGHTMAFASWLTREVGGGDCNVITSKGPAATQTVMHLHLHVVPRTEGDGLALPWTGQQPADNAPPSHAGDGS